MSCRGSCDSEVTQVEGRHATRACGAVVTVVVMLVTLSSSASAVTRASGPETFNGGLVASSTAGKRKVIGSAIAASGVFTGVGRIVERPNHPGEGDNISRDDLVFPAGTIHIVNRTRRMSLALNRRTCTAKFKAQQTTTVDGGTGKFAGATGTFDGTVNGSGTLRRKPDGRCDLQHGPAAEIDVVAAKGTLTF
jgi:hypothetical protein